MKQSLANLSRGARVYVLGVILIGIGVAGYSIADLIRHPVGPEWLILAVLTVASGWASLRIPGMPISFSISDTFIIAAALLFGPAAGAITAALDGLVLSSRMANSRPTLDRILFNMAALTIAIWVAAQIFFALEGNHPVIDGPIAALRLLATLVLFGLVDFSLNSGIVAVAVSFERRGSILTLWQEHLAGVWITYFGGIFGAMLVMLLARFRTLETLILILPLPVILYVTVRHALGRAEDQISHLGNLNKVYVAAIEALAHAVDAKDQVTHDHTRRVHDETMRLARALKVEGDAEIQAINAAALLHDVGKLAIPEHILNKPGPLTPAEYEIMKRHATIGADILSVIGLPYDVAPIVRHHHENWNGTGYPDGLAGDRIPIGSRILAVVDCFDALTSDRPYRPRMTDRDALQIVTDRRGNMYDPQVVDAFLASHAQGAATASVPSPAPVQAASRSISAPQPQPPVRVGERRDDVDLQLFFNVGRALADARSITDIGRVLWTHCRLALRASAFVLYAYDETSDAIVAVYTAGDLSGGIQGTRIPLGDRLSGWVAATGQAVMNSDGRLDFVTGGRDESRLRSALAAPIATDGRPLGVLTFYSEAANAFDDVQRRLVLALSAAIAASVLQLTPSSRAPGADVSQHGTGALQK